MLSAYKSPQTWSKSSISMNTVVEYKNSVQLLLPRSFVFVVIGNAIQLTIFPFIFTFAMAGFALGINSMKFNA